jgi:hypothetical protein
MSDLNAAATDAFLRGRPRCQGRDKLPAAPATGFLAGFGAGFGDGAVVSVSVPFGSKVPATDLRCFGQDWTSHSPVFSLQL